LHPLVIILFAVACGVFVTGFLRLFEPPYSRIPSSSILRMGLVVHRESIPLTDLPARPGKQSRRRRRRHRNEGKYFVRISNEEALFTAPPWIEVFGDAVVARGSVTIKNGAADIAYRASVGTAAFFILWFGGALVSLVGLCVQSPHQALAVASIGVPALVIGAFVVRRALRSQLSVLRGIALDAIASLRDQESAASSARR